MKKQWQLGILVMASCGGCATSLPTYTWIDDQQALEQMRLRDRDIETVTSPCRIILHRSDGASTQLEGAMAAALPELLRVRGWKLGQAAYDLTVTPEGCWLFAPSHDHDPGVPTADGTGTAMARGWKRLAQVLVGPDWTICERRAGPRLVVKQSLGQGGALLVGEIDRATLTLRRLSVLDGAGMVRQMLRLERYQVLGDHVWPSRIVAEEGGGGSITILLDDIELNVELPKGVFQPPRRAVLVP